MQSPGAVRRGPGTSQGVRIARIHFIPVLNTAGEFLMAITDPETSAHVISLSFPGEADS
jgi:hypothetical protein